MTAAARPTQVDYPTSRDVKYNYGSAGSFDDELSRIALLQHAGTGFMGTRDLAAYLHSGTDRLMEVRYKSASVSPEVYLAYFDSGTPGDYLRLDRFARVKSQLWKNTTPTTLDQFDYDHDLAGNRISRDLPASLISTLDQLYTNDGLDRLSNYDEGTISMGTIGSPTKEADWTFDTPGNWTNYVEKASGTTTLNQDRTHNAVNEVTTISATTGANWIDGVFDAAGNMTEAPKPTAETTKNKYIWDAWNRLVKVTDASDVTIGVYGYDGLNRRITRDWHIDSDVLHIHYYLSEQDQVLESQIALNAGALNVWHEFIWHPYYVDALAMHFNKSGSSYFYALQDANFNVTTMVTGSGVATERYSYTPYGKATVYNGSFTPGSSSIGYVFAYTGRQYDSETGLLYYRARYYHPTLGRFIGRDPIEYESGDPNLYQYVQSRPVNAVDPQGLLPDLSSILGVTWFGVVAFPIGSAGGVYVRGTATLKTGICRCPNGNCVMYTRLSWTLEGGAYVGILASNWQVATPVVENLKACPRAKDFWDGGFTIRGVLGPFVGTCRFSVKSADWHCQGSIRWTNFWSSVASIQFAGHISRQFIETGC